MRRGATVWLVVGLLFGGAAPAYPAATTEPVDVAADGSAPDGESGWPVISGDGRWVVFSSAARLTPDDSSDSVDVYVRDLAEDRTILVTPSPDDATRLNYDPAISDDGRYVAFTSQGRGLLPQDTNDVEDVYMRDLWTGETTVASAPEGGAAAAGGRYAALSGDGRWVAFVSNGLTPDDRSGDPDVYVRRVPLGRVVLVSRDNRGRQIRGGLDDVDVDYDASRVAYIVGGELYVFDRSTQRRVRADVNTRKRPAAHAWPFGNVALSANGHVVAFASTADNLSRVDDNGRPDVYVRDLRRERTEIVSTYSNGGVAQQSKSSWSVSISRTGRFVAFGSNAALTGEGDEGEFDVYVRDRREDRTLLASEGCSGGTGHPSMSSDALWVAFVSESCDVSAPSGMLFARGPLREP